MKSSLILAIAFSVLSAGAQAQSSFSPSLEPKKDFTSFSPAFPNKSLNMLADNGRIHPGSSGLELPRTQSPPINSVPTSVTQPLPQAVQPRSEPLIIRAPADCDVQNIDMQFVNSNPGLPMVAISVFCKNKDQLYLNYRFTRSLTEEKLPRSIQVVKDEAIKGRIEWTN